MKRLIYLSMATVLLIGLLPTATAHAAGLALNPGNQKGTASCLDTELTYTFSLTNSTGVDSFFDVTVSALWPMTCPAQVWAADSQQVPFQCTVPIPVPVGTDTATITVSGQGYSDSATATSTSFVDERGTWVDEQPSPMASQWGAVISWDGKLYLVGGTDTQGAVQIWDGVTWTVGAANGYSSTVDKDACLGLDASGNPVIDLVSGQPMVGIQRYDINADAWTSLPPPPGYPQGLNDAQIVSMLQHTGENVCYLTGGWSYSGVPYPSPLYAYDPAGQTMTNLGSFTYAPADLMDHFAWYVPWVEGGAICAAGGRYRYDTEESYADSQCYVLGSGLFHTPNVDLGPLPQEWQGGGDAWRENEGQYQIWGFQGWGTETSTFYATPGRPFVYGPETKAEFLAVEGDNYNGSVWAGNGSTAGYWPSTQQESLADCPQGCIPPVSTDFGWDPASPFTGDLVTLTAGVVGASLPLTYDWELGDGTALAGNPVEHTYGTPGDYPATLTANNSCGSAAAQHTVTVYGIPDIAVTPPSLAAEQPLNTQTTQTLQICNNGEGPLTWSVFEAPGIEALTPALSQGERGPATGPLPNKATALSQGERGSAARPLPPKLTLPFTKELPPPTGVAGLPRHPDAVLWDQPPSGNEYFYSDNWASDGFGVFSADDFQNTLGWSIDTIRVSGALLQGSLDNAASLNWCLYPDAGGSPAGHPFMGGETWCWSGSPSNPAVTYGGGLYGGDVTLDVVAALGAPLSVAPGHWWLLFYPEFATMADGLWLALTSATANLANAHAVDPMDGFGAGWTSWTPLAAIGVADWDLGFRLEGVFEDYDIPWLGEVPASGAVDPGACEDVTVTFDSTGLVAGAYAGNLVFLSNDPATPQVTAPVTLTVTQAEGPDISVTPASLSSEQCPDAQAIPTLKVCNDGTEDLTWSLGEETDLPWLGETPTGGTISPGDPCTDVAVTFDSAGLPPGVYTGNLLVDSNDPAEPQVTVPVALTVLESPYDVDYTWAPSNPVVNAPVTFTGAAQGGGLLDYAWDFGDGGGGGGAVVNHAYAAPGDYLVTLTVSNDCDSAQIQHTVHIYAGPLLRFEPAELSAELCPGAQTVVPVQVCNDGDLDLDWSMETAPSWAGWTPSSGAVLPGRCQAVDSFFDSAGLAPGYYSGAVHGHWQVDSFFDVFTELTVKDPVHDAGFDWTPPNPVAGETVTFQAGALGTAPILYEWDMGDGGGGGIGPVVTHAYATAGTYLVTLTASNECGRQVVTHEVVVAPAPCVPVHDAEFTWDPPSPYAGQEVTFAGAAQGSEPIHYAWAFNTQGGTEGDNPMVHVFDATGDYLVSMWAWNDCGQQLVQHTVTVQEPPPILHVGFVHLRTVDRGMGRYALRGRVLIEDMAGQVAPAAMVYVEWTAPNGVVTPQARETNWLGEVAFKAQTHQTGTWQLCVTDVVKAGWVYDPDQNAETCRSITVPITGR